jgi:hypothetical protein
MSAREAEFIDGQFWEEVLGKGNLEVVDEIIPPDFTWRDPLIRPHRGPGEVKEFVEAFHKAFPEIQVTIQDRVAVEENHVVTRWECHAIRGSEKIFLGGMSISHVRDGQIEQILSNTLILPPPPYNPIDWWCQLCKCCWPPPDRDEITGYVNDPWTRLIYPLRAST